MRARRALLAPTTPHSSARYQHGGTPHMSTVFITGSNDGLGRDAAHRLIDDGHTVVGHARNSEKADRLRRHLPAIEDVLVADLSSMKQVRRLAEEANDLGGAWPRWSRRLRAPARRGRHTGRPPACGRRPPRRAEPGGRDEPHRHSPRRADRAAVRRLDPRTGRRRLARYAPRGRRRIRPRPDDARSARVQYPSDVEESGITTTPMPARAPASPARDRSAPLIDVEEHR
jgi:short chain dehydrogenase